jgi:hypothetical protein
MEQVITWCKRANLRHQLGMLQARKWTTGEAREGRMVDTTAETIDHTITGSASIVCPVPDDQGSGSPRDVVHMFCGMLSFFEQNEIAP